MKFFKGFTCKMPITLYLYSYKLQCNANSNNLYERLNAISFIKM